MTLAFPDATVEVYPDEGTWLAAREASIGSSDGGGLWDAVPQGAEGVISKKLGLDPPWEDFTAADDEKQAGKELEEFLVGWAGRNLGARVQHLSKTIARSKKEPWLSATLDGLLFGDAVEVIEAKATKRLIEWDPDLIRWPTLNWDRGDRPLRWIVQVQHQLMVTGLKVAHLAVLIGGDLKLRHARIERNEEFIARHRARCERAWREIEERRALGLAR